MNIILVSDNLSKSVTVSLAGKRFWVALLLLLASLAAAVNFVAERLAARWAEARDPRIVEIVDDVRARGEEERTRLWGDALESTQGQIAEIEVRIWRLLDLSDRIAERIGVEAAEPPPPQDTPQKELESIEDLSSKLGELDTQLKESERRMASLKALYGHRQMRLNTIPLKRPEIIGVHRRTSGYGYRKDPFTGRRAFHSGYDFAARVGTPIKAAADGRVIYRDRLGNYGKVVEVYHGDGVSTLYAHLSEYRTDLSDYVSRGDIIALIGNTGRSSGPHLHYEIRHRRRPQSARFVDQLIASREQEIIQ